MAVRWKPAHAVPNHTSELECRLCVLSLPSFTQEPQPLANLLPIADPPNGSCSCVRFTISLFFCYPTAETKHEALASVGKANVPKGILATAIVAKAMGARATVGTASIARVNLAQGNLATAEAVFVEQCL